MTITADLETITPAVAAQMLLANTSNRNIIAHTVASYAEAMLRGEWNPHSTITFAEDGTLLDGQHRAAAVVKSGVPIQAIVVRGAAMEAQETIDTGSRRTFGALLAIRGVKNAHNVASAVKILWRIETGNMRAHGTATNRQLLDVMDRHPGVADHASFPGQKNLGAIGVGMSRPLSAALRYSFCAIDDEDGRAFFDALASGEGLMHGSPILALRQRMESAAARNPLAKPSTTVIAAWTIKAWNAWREGREVAQIKWTVGGASPEAFPTITEAA